LFQDQFAGNRLEQGLAQNITMGSSGIVRRSQSLDRNRKTRGMLLIYAQWRNYIAKHTWYVLNLVHLSVMIRLIFGIVHRKTQTGSRHHQIY